MKAILEFDFDKEDRNDKAEHAKMLKADDLCSCLYDFDQYLRERLKYGDKFKSGEEELDDARQKLHEIMAEYAVNLDALYA